jgi:hypothetical protein
MIEVLSHIVAAAQCTPTAGGNLSQICAGGLPTSHADQTSINTTIELVLNIVGGLALLMVIVSGLRYVLSAGDPQKTSKAKSGIIYSLVGLVIAITAQAIVLFVANRLVQP